MSYLNDWAGVIKRQGEESDKREKERVKKIKKDSKNIKPDEIRNTELLALYDHCRGSSGDHNPKVGKEYEKTAGKLRAEILSRMKDK